MKNHSIRFPITLIVLTLLCLLTYGELVNYYFTDVDTFSLINQGRFQSWAEIKTVLVSELMAGRMVNAAYYRPLTSLIFGFTYNLFGLRPVAFHILDLLVFIFGVFLMVDFCRLALGEKRGSWIGLLAGIFCVLHPINVDNLPANARLGDLLMVLFSLGSISTFLRFLLSNRPGIARWFTYSLSIFFSLAAFAAKEPGLIAPAFLGILALGFLQESSVQKRILKTILLIAPHLILMALLFFWHQKVVGGVGGYVSLEGKFKTGIISLFTLKATFLGHFFGLLFPSLSDHFDRATFWFFHKAWLIYPLMILLLGTVVAYLISLALQVFSNTYLPGENKNFSDDRVIWFATCALLLHYIFLALAQFSIRYLSLSLPFFSIILGILLVRFFEQRKFLKLKWIAATLSLLVLTLTYVHSPLWNKERMRRWQIGAEIDRQILQDLEVKATQKPNQMLALANIPYTIMYGTVSPIFWELPLNQMLLEHAIIDYLALRELETKQRFSDILVLNYLFYLGDPKGIEIETAFIAPDKILVNVKKGGLPSEFPWSEIKARQTFRDYFHLTGGRLRFKAEPKEGWTKEMLIELTPTFFELKNPLFFAFDGKTLQPIHAFDSKQALLAKQSLSEPFRKLLAGK